MGFSGCRGVASTVITRAGSNIDDAVAVWNKSICVEVSVRGIDQRPVCPTPGAADNTVKSHARIALWIQIHLPV